ncbi:hypothetical protein B0T18DRAFT_362078 [Schizothecium vesticola]|uniref:Uncharacterized protein n=1 Tax=Schizothecium vesticola TaxID=314040 RepID=A0AA40F5P4_9PEZI|nr:hypothetical protein B0T18DRAFT_362078 [Schizothecium vesticola]
MSHNIGVDGPRDTPPAQRARHQISRSISELSSPIRLHRHQSHTRVVRDRERDGLNPLSPTAQGRLSLDGSRSDGVTLNYSPEPSRNASRRTSIMMASGDDAPAATTAGTTIANGAVGGTATKASAEDALALERQRALARESGLKKSLAELEDFTTTTTARLDGLYESVDEKLGTLQSTILALKELVGLSDQMNHVFNADAKELTTDISSQLDAFGQFEDQQRRIEKLQGRILTGRDKIRVLSKRVDLVMDRIENWERADREWQERTRKRLKAVWVVTSIVLFCLLFLFLGAQYGYAPEGVEGQPGRPAIGGPDVAPEAMGGGIAAGNMLSVTPNAEKAGGARNLFLNGTSTEGTAAFTPDALRLLDEL